MAPTEEPRPTRFCRRRLRFRRKLRSCKRCLTTPRTISFQKSSLPHAFHRPVPAVLAQASHRLSADAAGQLLPKLPESAAPDEGDHPEFFLPRRNRLRRRGDLSQTSQGPES